MTDNNTTKAELFAALHSLAELVPEMRAGQLVAAIGELCTDIHGRGLWDAADTELLEAAWQFRRNFETAMAAAGQPAGQPSSLSSRSA
jgi:hypothetical protein